MQIEDALRYAKLLALTEGVNLYDNLDGMKDTVTALGYEYIHTIHGSQLATYFTPRLGAETMFGFVAREPDGSYVVALRCTNTILEALHDAAFFQIPNPIKGARKTFVSAGFSAIYQSLRVFDEKGEEFLPSYLNRIICNRYPQCTIKTTIVGHSLGGACATLLALDLALNTAIKVPVVYTFGSPRVGDPLFARLYNSHIKESYRIVEKWDAIQAVPLIPAYWHVQKRECIKMKWNWYPRSHHRLSTYIEVLQRMLDEKNV